MAVDQEFVEKYEELLTKYEAQDALLIEANTSLENLRWGFKKRETVLLGQVEQYKVMAVKLYESNIKLRDNLRHVCENMCEELENAEQIAEQPAVQTTEQPIDDQSTVTPIQHKGVRGTILSPADQTSVVESMKRRIVELETALNQQLIVAKSTPVKSPTPRSASNRATAIYGGGLMGGAGTRKGTGTPTISPHTLPPAGLTTVQLGQVQRSSSTTGSSSSLRSPPVVSSPTRSAKTSNKNKVQEQTAASELLAAERAVEREQWQQRERQLTEQVSVLQEELRTLQRAKIAAERQLIHYLRESRRGEFGTAHSPSSTSHHTFSTYRTSLSPDQRTPSQHTATEPANHTNEDHSMPLQLSNGEVEFLKDSLLQSLVEKNSLEKKLGLLQEYVTVLRQRLKVMDDFAQNIDAVHAGEELKPRFSFPEGFMSSQGGSDKDKGSDMFSDRDRGWDKSSDREGFPGLGLGLGQESAVSAAMMNVPVVTLEYADTMSLQHLHTLFERRMAVRKGSDIPSPGPVAKSPAHYTTSPTQHTSSLSVAQSMAYEIDETTALLARHVAALDDISAKITHPLNAGQGHGQGQGQVQGLVTGQRQGVVTGQGLHMANATDMMTSSASPWQRLHLDIDDSNDADTIGNRTNNHMTSAVQLTSSGSHNEDTMAVALREQIQALMVQKRRLDRAVADMHTDASASPRANISTTITSPSSSSTSPTSPSSPHVVNHLANVLQQTRATIAASVVVNTHQQDQHEMALLTRLQQEYQEYHHNQNRQPVTR